MKIPSPHNLIAFFLFFYFLAGGWNRVVWCSQALDHGVQAGSAAVSERFAKAPPTAEGDARIKGESSRRCLKLPPTLVPPPAPHSPESKQSPVRLPLASTSLATAFSKSADRSKRYAAVKAPPPHPQLAHLRTVVLLN